MIEAVDSGYWFYFPVSGSSVSEGERWGLARILSLHINFSFSTVNIENQDSYFLNIEWGERHNLTIQSKWSTTTDFIYDFSGT